MKKSTKIIIFATLLAMVVGGYFYLLRSVEKKHNTIELADLSKYQVKYKFKDRALHVPLAYHWYEKIKRGGRWPRPKSEYIETSAFMIAATIPEMLPYSEKTRHLFDKKIAQGDIVRVLVNYQEPPLNRSLDEFFTLTKPSRVGPSEVAKGLIHYVESRDFIKESSRDDLYFYEKNKPSDWFSIRCNRPNEPDGPKRYPSCKANYFHKDDPRAPNIYVSYTFGIKHLSEWQVIHESVVNLVSSFLQKK